MRSMARGTGSDSLAENLRLLCSYKRSVSEVCRRLQINRQQFARYLTGETIPSSGNIRKICDYFGVEEHEILMPAEQFRDIIVVRTRQPIAPFDTSMGDLAKHIKDDAGHLSHRYIGCYYRYLRSIEYRGSIIKACVRVFENGGRVWLKSIERMKVPGAPRDEGFDVYKYNGVLMHMSDRIFIVETDTILNSGITETILYPNHKNPMSLLFGKAIGISSGLSREPYLTPIVYEFLGSYVPPRLLVANCGLLPEDSPQIDARIRGYLLSESNRA